MPTLIILCGIPGSGKTTLSKEINNIYNYSRISMDENKYLHHSDMIPEIINNLTSGKNVIVDVCYAKRKFRKTLLDAIKDIDCKRICIHVQTPLESCQERNYRRSRRVPSFLINCMYSTFEHPTKDEGWDEIFVFDNSKNTRR